MWGDFDLSSQSLWGGGEASLCILLFLVLEQHPPIPAHPCLLPFQAKLAEQWLWWQCSLLNSSRQKFFSKAPHPGAMRTPCLRRFSCLCGDISSSMGVMPRSQSNLGGSVGLILGADCATET